jgi:hypothetical protein
LNTNTFSGLPKNWAAVIRDDPIGFSRLQNIFLSVEGKRDGSLPKVDQGCARFPGGHTIGRGRALLPRTPKNWPMALADPVSGEYWIRPRGELAPFALRGLTGRTARRAPPRRRRARLGRWLRALARISHTGWGFEAQPRQLHADVVAMKVRNLRESPRTQWWCSDWRCRT